MSIIQVSAPVVSFDGALFEGDSDFLAEIVTLFLETYPQLISAIEEAIERQDAVALCRTTHTMKGAVANFGAEAVVEQVRALEMMGKTGDLSASGEAWRGLQVQMETFVPELEAVLKRVTEEQVVT